MTVIWEGALAYPNDRSEVRIIVRVLRTSSEISAPFSTRHPTRGAARSGEPQTRDLAEAAQESHDEKARQFVFKVPDQAFGMSGMTRGKELRTQTASHLLLRVA